MEQSEIKLDSSIVDNPQEIKETTPEQKTEESKEITPKDDNDISRIEIENERLEKALLRREQLMARAKMGGRADAGQKEKTPEDEAKEQADIIVKRFGK